VNSEVDVAIIGAGTAGLSALAQVKKRTNSFVLIDQGPYGTTCARVGCMPSKALIEAANVFHKRNLYREMGLLMVGSVAVDGKAVMQRVRTLRDRFTAGVMKTTDRLDEDHSIKGKARILAPDLVEVNGRRIRTRRLVIATGSTPLIPGPWRSLGKGFLTSDELFEMEDLPESMAVIGLGAIGLEMAQALSRLGVSVVGFDALHTVGGITDPHLSSEALKMIGEDFPIYPGTKAELEGRTDGRITVSWNGYQAVVDKVLAAVGRVPAIEGLGLENLGVPLDQDGLPSFNRHTLQVAELPVFLAGDVNRRAPILHEAADDGHIAGYNAMQSIDNEHCFCRRAPIGIVFTHPNIAYAGQRFADLDMDEAVIAGESFAGQSRAVTAGENGGLLRLYASRVTAKLLGAEMMIPGGEHIAHLLSWSVQRGLTVFQMLELPFYHPVLEEGVRGALRKLAEKIENRESAPEVPLCRELPQQSLDMQE
jgi:dihydrolipoamide dehydrogenase